VTRLLLLYGGLDLRRGWLSDLDFKDRFGAVSLEVKSLLGNTGVIGGRDMEPGSI
jgi:hypothetical protein